VEISTYTLGLFAARQPGGARHTLERAFDVFGDVE
jgi:hypothetical protein